ncbi:MAG TPA: hypothetical protein VGD09_13595 [Blastococcus sp.]
MHQLAAPAALTAMQVTPQGGREVAERTAEAGVGVAHRAQLLGDLLTALRAEALDAVLADLDDTAWLTPTPAVGWKDPARGYARAFLLIARTGVLAGLG